MQRLDAESSGTTTDTSPAVSPPQYLMVQDDKAQLYLIAIVALVILAIIVIYMMQNQRKGG
jgi:uncharacterized integral membrane protein